MKEIVFKGKILDVEREEMLVKGRKKVVERAVLPDVVMVVPFLDKETVLLGKNFRPVINKTIYEFCAGKIDKGEKPIDAARRELEEEFGYLAGKLEHLGGFYSSPGRVTEYAYLFKATRLKKTAARLEEFEVIEPTPVRIKELLKMVRRGEVEDAKTIAALQKVT